jgi:hypothetical protein
MERRKTAKNDSHRRRNNMNERKGRRNRNNPMGKYIYFKE